MILQRLSYKQNGNQHDDFIYVACSCDIYTTNNRVICGYRVSFVCILLQCSLLIILLTKGTDKSRNVGYCNVDKDWIVWQATSGLYVAI